MYQSTKLVMSLVLLASVFCACGQEKKVQSDALVLADAAAPEAGGGAFDGSAVLADANLDAHAGPTQVDAPWTGMTDGSLVSADGLGRDTFGDRAADRGAGDAPDVGAGKVDAVVVDANLGRDLVGPRPSTCFGRRTNLTEDPMNCGACGNVCEATCSEGVCTEACQLPLKQIGSGVCADPRSDPRNCGGFGCNAAQVCQEGRCETMCELGKALCAGDCVILAMDNKNCGSCGHVCPAGTGCTSGGCLSCGLLFPALPALAAPEKPSSVVSADLDGDGKLDLVTLGEGIATFLGKGDGTFAAERRLAADVVGQLAAADVDGDGKLDVLAASSARDAIVVLPGSGDGLFGPAHSTPVSAAGKPLVADLNADGRVDVAVLGADNAVKILLGAAGFAFAPATSYGLDSPVTLLESGDLDGDGKADLVVAGVKDGRIHALFGVGDGTFKAPQLLQTVEGLSALAVGDLNNDGKADIVVDANNQVVVLQRPANHYPQGRAGISVPKAQGPLILADVDADDRLDVVVGSAPRGTDVHVLLSSSYGRVLGLPQTTTVGEMDAIALGDFDGDGRLDVARASRMSEGVRIFLGLGQGIFRGVGVEAGAALSGLIVADLDQDGLDDILGHKTGYNLLSIFTGKYRWDSEQQWDIPADAGSVFAVADLNGDGRQDIAIGSNRAKNLCLVLSKADGSHTTGLYNFDTMMDALVLGDWNGDGKIDYAAASRAASDVTVVQGQGGNGYGDATHYPVPSGPGQIFAVDMDGDGKKDLLVAGSGSVSYLASKGDGTFATAKSISDAGIWAEVGDFDENGIVDVAVLGLREDVLSPAIGVLLGSGGGAFAAPKLYPYDDRAEVSDFSVGDVDGDGHLDLMLPGSRTNGITYWLGRGDGSFAQASAPGAPYTPARLADLDHDGRADLILFDQNGFSVLKAPRDCARTQ